jgi:hypothetical protein
VKRAAILALLLACGDSPPADAPHGAVTGVTVILKGSREPLPFDPRGGRITIVTREIEQLVGHPIILELDTAPSPELKASLEETVLASFETIAKELVWLQKDDPEMFAQARAIERVVCKYDAVAKESDGELSGDELRVTSPPDRFPLLERGVLIDAVYAAHVAELDKRWGDLDPSRLTAVQQEPYFAYMMSTRPGAGYLWIAARAKQRDWDALREEHFRRIMRLSNAIGADVPRGNDPKSGVARKVRHFLGENAAYASTRPGLHAEYAAWLNREAAALDDEERVKLAREIFEHRSEVTIPGFDRFAWGLSLYDQWQAGKIAPGSELEKLIVCPSKRRGEAETEIKWSCSAWFATTLGDPQDRAAFRSVVLARPEKEALRLQELALLNVGHDEGKQAVAYVESVASRPALFTDGVRVLFHDNARRDDVRDALLDAAPRWWRDYPNQRGLTLLILARRSNDLHVHYADNAWTRFVQEYGGPLKSPVLAQFIAEGPRAVEMLPKMWLALPKNADRDDQVAKSLRVLLERDRADRTSRATPVLTMLRMRLCIEKNGAALATMRSAIESWANEHADLRASGSNALADFTLARCPKDPSPDAESGR